MPSLEGYILKKHVAKYCSFFKYVWAPSGH